MERWFDHAVRVLTVAAILWTANVIVSLQADNQVMLAKIEFMSQQIAELKSGVARRYTADDAARDFRAANERIQDHETRIRDLEKGLKP